MHSCTLHFLEPSCNHCKQFWKSLGSYYTVLCGRYCSSYVLTPWWSVSGIIHYNFLNPGKTLTAETYEKCTRNFKIYMQHWSVVKDHLFSMAISDCMSCKWFCKNGTKETMNLNKFLQEMIFNNKLVAQNAFEKLICERISIKYQNKSVLLLTTMHRFWCFILMFFLIWDSLL